ncbi:MAG: M20 family metallo-hydrolase [Bacteroidota bacterium]
MNLDNFHALAYDTLCQLIATPSLSREEKHTADLLQNTLEAQGWTCQRKGNNVWVKSRHWRADQPTVLLNSHHDTVKPAQGWQRNPFEPLEENGCLYGLGSNDAGAALCCLMGSFLALAEEESLGINLIFAATAEEEISGSNGIASILEELGSVDLAIVGEPTQMRMAIAEKGLMVIDAEAKGQAGHAAREEGVNALYIALEDIDRIRTHQFEKVSELLGPVKMSVTQIQAGHQHNVVPDRCQFVIDIRSNEHYSNEEIFQQLQSMLSSELKARSFRLSSSGISPTHPLVQAGQAMGLAAFGSPTLSDQALLPFTSLKIGPGQSARSHTADEFIRLDELRQGLELYVQLIQNYAVRMAQPQTIPSL